MKFFLATLALVGSAVAHPHSYTILPVTSYPVSSPSTMPASSTPVFSTTPASSTIPASSTTPASSTVSATPTPWCDIESDGDNGNHYGWCKKANHWGTYKNGKSGDADNKGPSEEN